MFDREELRLVAFVVGVVFCARAEPERLVVVAGANAGVARNTAVRSGIRNLRNMVFLPGLIPHHSPQVPKLSELIHATGEKPRKIANRTAALFKGATKKDAGHNSEAGKDDRAPRRRARTVERDRGPDDGISDSVRTR